ncbi:MAG: protein kinase [Oscillatoria princeps RMCB-10]|jgi:serine/threonine-protein kinase|nr:protein kinase [Oscillatoria princeps RMCB-10]
MNSLPAGRVLKNGQYAIEALLTDSMGQGKFGITYRATQVESNLPVAIKTLSARSRQHPDFEQFHKQFLARTQKLLECQHPHLVRVRDCFEEAGLFYAVMEYIPGQTLAQITDSQPLPEATAIHYIRQIGAGLSLAHQTGLLHLDIKPQNIILRQGSNTAVLTDFSYACELTLGVDRNRASLSAGYAPVELYLPTAPRTPATDIYALAATLYCLLIGFPPVAAPLRVTRTKTAAASNPVSLPERRQLQLNLSQAVKQAIRQGLQIKPHRRAQTVEEWLELLPQPQTATNTQSLAHQPSSTVADGAKREILVFKDPNGSRTGTETDAPQLPAESAPPRPPARQSQSRSHTDSNTASFGGADFWIFGEFQDVRPNSSQPPAPSAPKPRAVTPNWQDPQVRESLPLFDSCVVPVPFPTQAPAPAHPAADRAREPAETLSAAPDSQPAPSTQEGRQDDGDPEPAASQPSRRWVPVAFIVTAAVAGAAGAGTGLALRFNSAGQPGSTLFHADQSFPARNDWPGSDPAAQHADATGTESPSAESETDLTAPPASEPFQQQESDSDQLGAQPSDYPNPAPEALSAAETASAAPFPSPDAAESATPLTGTPLKKTLTLPKRHTPEPVSSVLPSGTQADTPAPQPFLEVPSYDPSFTPGTGIILEGRL